jgi:hypothetical protein
MRMATGALVSTKRGAFGVGQLGHLPRDALVIERAGDDAALAFQESVGHWNLG